MIKSQLLFVSTLLWYYFRGALLFHSNCTRVAPEKAIQTDSFKKWENPKFYLLQIFDLNPWLTIAAIVMCKGTFCENVVNKPDFCQVMENEVNKNKCK